MCKAKNLFFEPKFGRKVLQVAALALNIFEHILSSIHVYHSQGNPDEYTTSKTAVIDVYFSRLLG